MTDPEKVIHHALETGANYRPASQLDLAQFESRLTSAQQRQGRAGRRWVVTTVAAAAVAGVVILGVALGSRAGAPHSSTSSALQRTDHGSTSISLVRTQLTSPAATLTTSSVPEPIPSSPLGDFALSKTAGLGLLPGVPVQMTFTVDTLTVRGACNTFTFHLSITGKLLTAGGSTSSLRACAGGRGAWDKSLTQFIEGSATFRFESADMLVLEHGSKQIVLHRTTTSLKGSAALDPQQSTSTHTR